MLTVNIKSSKRCAFCIHWYDPSNSKIKPKSARINLWTFDEKDSSYCEIKRHDMRSAQSCSGYECKL
jgi:hypothetical protein